MTRPGSLVLVHTGDGKGKTSSAVGVVVRAWARGWRVGVVQFFKSGAWKTGERKLADKLGLEWYEAGDGFTWESTDLDETAALARTAWEESASLIHAGDHDLLLLDEISYACHEGWIDPVEVAAVLRARPERVNVVLTGRGMPSAIVDVADTVTEMRKVKHAFDRGVKARRGIDY